MMQAMRNFQVGLLEQLSPDCQCFLLFRQSLFILTFCTLHTREIIQHLCHLGVFIP